MKKAVLCLRLICAVAPTMGALSLSFITIVPAVSAQSADAPTFHVGENVLASPTGAANDYHPGVIVEVRENGNAYLVAIAGEGGAPVVN